MVSAIREQTLPDVPRAEGLPFIGNSMHFIGSDGIPLDYMESVSHKQGDVVRFDVMGKVIYLVNHPDLVQEVLVKRINEFEKPEALSEKPAGLGRFLGKGILTAGQEAWRPQRKLIQPLMHTQHIKLYADTMLRLGEHLLSSWENGKQRDIRQDMTDVTMWIISETMFGMPVDQAPNFEASIEAIQAIALSDFTSPLPSWLAINREKSAREYNQAMTDLVEYFKEHIRSRPQDEERFDLLSLLMQARDSDGNPVSDKFIRDNILTLFFAGHETTANTLSWVFYYLSQHPQIAEKLHHELDTVLNGRTPTLDDLVNLPYTTMVIKEVMRIEPIVPVLPRRYRGDTELGGYHLEEGGVVFMSPYMLHRDERFWDKPEQFDPQRFSPENEANIHKYAYIPFGGGGRICIGNHFAMMEAQILLALIASRYELELSPDAIVKPLRQITTSPKNGLMMTPVLR